MSKREKISADLSAYLDGELSQTRRSEVEKVLQYDKDLAGELERLKATRRLIGDLPGQNPPADFVHRVVARGERMHLLVKRRSKLYWWMPTASAAAAVLLAAAGAVTIIFHQHQAGPVKHAEEQVVTLARADKIDVCEIKAAPVLKPLSEVRCLTEKDASVTKLSAQNPQNVEIYTDNLALAQRDVKNVLIANNIQPQTRITGETDKLSNVFKTNIETTSQVQYIAFVPADQMGKLRTDLNSVIARQRVLRQEDGFQFMAKVKRSSAPATMPTTRVVAKPVGRRLNLQREDNVKLTITLNLGVPSLPAAPAADEKK